ITQRKMTYGGFTGLTGLGRTPRAVAQPIRLRLRLRSTPRRIGVRFASLCWLVGKIFLQSNTTISQGNTSDSTVIYPLTFNGLLQVRSLYVVSLGRWLFWTCNLESLNVYQVMTDLGFSHPGKKKKGIHVADLAPG